MSKTNPPTPLWSGGDRGVGQRGDLFAALCHGLDDLVGQTQAVDHGGGQAVALGRHDVGFVAGLEFAGVRADLGCVR